MPTTPIIKTTDKAHAPEPIKLQEHGALISRVKACVDCAVNLPMGPRPVLQHHPDAKILIVGQAPGRRVHESGIPFDDPSGDRLRLWLGIDKECFYDEKKLAILPMAFCYPGTGKSGDLAPRPECLQWRPDLLALLPNVKLTVVLGQYAQRYHFPDFKGNLTALVQSWQDHWPEKIPLPHPSPRNNLWLKKNPWFEGEVLPPLKEAVARSLAASDVEP